MSDIKPQFVQEIDIVFQEIPDQFVHVGQFPMNAGQEEFSPPAAMWKDPKASLNITSVTGNLTTEQKWLRKPWTLETPEGLHIGQTTGLMATNTYYVLHRVNHRLYHAYGVEDWYSFKRYLAQKTQTAKDIDDKLRLEGEGRDVQQKYRKRRRPGVLRGAADAAEGGEYADLLDKIDSFPMDELDAGSDNNDAGSGKKAGGDDEFGDEDNSVRSDDDEEIDLEFNRDLFEYMDDEIQIEFEDELKEETKQPSAADEALDEVDETELVPTQPVAVEVAAEPKRGARGAPQPMDVDGGGKADDSNSNDDESVERDVDVSTIARIGVNMFAGKKRKPAARKDSESSSSQGGDSDESDYSDSRRKRKGKSTKTAKKKTLKRRAEEPPTAQPPAKRIKTESGAAAPPIPPQPPSASPVALLSRDRMLEILRANEGKPIAAVNAAIPPGDENKEMLRRVLREAVYVKKSENPNSLVLLRPEYK